MAGLTSLAEVLHEEHFRILVGISDLQNWFSGDGNQCFSEVRYKQGEMEGLVGSLDHVLAHETFEENVVFPLIRVQGAPDLADFLAREHVAIAPATRKLRTLVIEILRHGPGAGRWRRFQQLAQKLFPQVLDHLHTEELAILQRLDRLLDIETDHHLARQCLSSRPLSVAGRPGSLRLPDARNDSVPGGAELKRSRRR